MTYNHEMTVELDEAYPFLIEEYGKVTGALNVSLSGVALIGYNDPDDWVVSNFTIYADNYAIRTKRERDAWPVTLDEGPIFEAVKNYIVKIRREDIESKIHESLYEDDAEYRRDFNISNAA